MRYWRKLDNAAKIFPSAANGHDTNVFRLYCELNENVNHSILQEALDKTIQQYPIFRSVMKKGVFWYYLEDSLIKPVVKEEYKKPCDRIYDKDVKKLLFEVTYYKTRINLEAYHVLTDGTGAEEFLKTLVFNYICLKYNIKSECVEDVVDSSDYQKANDSYKKYYEKDKSKTSKIKHSYKIEGEKTPNKELKIIEGVMSCEKVLDKAHEYGTTITSFFTAVLIKSIYEEMDVSDRKKPVVVSVPVNLRKYFESASARNFFGVIFVSYDFSKQSDELKDIIEYVDKFLKRELDKEKIKERMNSLIGVEKNIIIRAVPLLIKNFVLRIAFKASEKKETTTISNIGKISMPKPFEQYIHSFGMFVATNKLQAGVCTYNDVLTLSFSSCFLNADIQRRFFRLLAEMDISIEINVNLVGE